MHKMKQCEALFTDLAVLIPDLLKRDPTKAKAPRRGANMTLVDGSPDCPPSWLWILAHQIASVNVEEEDDKLDN